MGVAYRERDRPIIPDGYMYYAAVPEYVLFDEDGVKDVHPYNPYLLEIHAAVLHGDIVGLRSILDHLDEYIDGDIDEVTEYGETALHYACQHGDRACGKLLLERGANLEAIGYEGLTPLHILCDHGFVKMMKLLLNSACSRDSECIKRIVEAVDDDGETPLHLAARNGYLKCIKVLLDFGADPSKPNDEGQTPREILPPGSEAAQFMLSKAESKIFFGKF